MRLHLPATLGSCGFPTPHFSVCRLHGLGSRGQPPGYPDFSSAQRFHCGLALPALTALRYYDGSDSCGPSPRAAGLPACLRSLHLPSIPPPATLRAPVSLYTPQTSVPDVFRTSPWKSRLVATHCRIEFVVLRTASSPPVAPHPASQRRSYLRLQGLGLPWHRLSLC